MAKPLSRHDLDFILFSLQETRKKLESFDDSPDPDYQQSRIREVDKIADKVRALREELS